SGRRIQNGLRSITALVAATTRQRSFSCAITNGCRCVHPKRTTRANRSSARWRHNSGSLVFLENLILEASAMLHRCLSYVNGSVLTPPYFTVRLPKKCDRKKKAAKGTKWVRIFFSH